AILYECLTGRPPFRAATPLDTLLQVVGEEPVPPARLQPGVPRDLETVCLKCLRKSPGTRYPSALNLAEDLKRFLAGERGKAGRGGGGERRARGPGGRPPLPPLPLAVAPLTAGGFAAVLWQSRDAEQRSERARRSLFNAQLWRVAAVAER